MSGLDWTMSQAHEGGTVEAQLLQVKSQLEPDLDILFEEVSAKRIELDQTYEDAQFLPTEAYNSQVVLDDLWVTAKPEIDEYKQNILRAERVRTGFALRHGLSRLPIKPDAVQSFILLGIYCLTETVVNAGFLNNANMVAGSIEALITAGMISLTNVTVSTAAGYFILRWLSYGQNTAEPDLPEFKTKREAAWVGFFVFIGLMLLFHLTVGLIRSQESLHHIEHSISRYLEILTTPESLFLVMVGMVLSVLSLNKGMIAYGDPYPGYGEKQHCVERAQDQLKDCFESLKEEISDRFEEKRETLKDIEKKTLLKRYEFNNKVGDWLKIKCKLDRYVNQAESQLRNHTGMITHHHRAAAGHGIRRIPIAGLEQFVHFNKYRISNSPACLSMPDFSKTKADLDKAEAAALQHLAVLFENAINTNAGD